MIKCLFPLGRDAEKSRVVKYIIKCLQKAGLFNMQGHSCAQDTRRCLIFQVGTQCRLKLGNIKTLKDKSFRLRQERVIRQFPDVGAPSMSNSADLGPKCMESTLICITNLPLINIYVYVSKYRYYT